MARPQTQNELITANNIQFEKLLGILESIPPTCCVTDFPLVFADNGSEAHWQRDKNCKGIIVHLYEWQRLWLEWVDANMAGEKHTFLPSPYTWNNYAGLNEEFKEKHQNTTYREALALLKTTHDDVLARVHTLSNEELFNKKYFSFTGTTSLGSYTVSATSSHYEWAIKKIRTYKNLCNNCKPNPCRYLRDSATSVPSRLNTQLYPSF
ncbi:ClbS/DfsB family four-helix bundle protein [Arcanobacterium phocae]|uniref:ClbS/DfsB family four-helix bundle protein n=1 Tax=Arcanobacterium phocae TaxID=131112 RepID=UPI001C0EFEAD